MEASGWSQKGQTVTGVAGCPRGLGVYLRKNGKPLKPEGAASTTGSTLLWRQSREGPEGGGACTGHACGGRCRDSAYRRDSLPQG